MVAICLGHFQGIEKASDVQTGTIFPSILMVLVWSLAPSLNLMNSVFSNLLFKLQENFLSKRTPTEPYSEPTCRKFQFQRSNKKVIFKKWDNVANVQENDASLQLNYLAINFLINEKSKQNSISLVISLALSGMIIQSWVYPTGVVIQY